jgi:hypothetical protein
MLVPSTDSHMQRARNDKVLGRGRGQAVSVQVVRAGVLIHQRAVVDVGLR